MSSKWNSGPNIGVAEPTIVSGAYMELTPVRDAGVTTELIKTENWYMASGSEAGAQVRVEMLRQYLAGLVDSHVPMAEIRGVHVVPAEMSGRWSVQYTMEYVPGEKLYNLADQQGVDSGIVQQGLRQIIGILGRMPIMAIDASGKHQLLQVMDAGPHNWRFDVRRGEFVLVDVFPPLLRDEHGKLRTEGLPIGPSEQKYFECTACTLEGAIAELLLQTYHVFYGLQYGAMCDIAKHIDRWRELIPRGLHESVADALQTSITGHGCTIDEAALRRLAAPNSR